MNILTIASNVILAWNIIIFRSLIVTISQAKITLLTYVMMFILDSDSLYVNKYEIHFQSCVLSQKYVCWKLYKNMSGIQCETAEMSQNYGVL